MTHVSKILLPAALRRRLSAVLNPQPDLGVSQDLTQSFGHDCHCPSSTATPRPASASSKKSTISISSNASGYSTPDLEKPQTLTTYESNSGLRWNRVSPAFSLLRSAAYEAQQLDPDTRLVRSLFIDGVGYLLEALPADLTDEEARSLYDRLPGPVKPNVDNTPRSPSPGSYTPPPSYLHRMIATAIVYGFIVAQLVLPYARMLLNTIYTYERRHRVTERAFAAALQLADGVGKGAGNIEPALTRLGDGRVLPRVYSLTAWTMESIAGGVYDGVSKGIAGLEGGSYHAGKT